MKAEKDITEKKRKVGRPEKRTVESIPDTPENIARALFGIKSENPNIESLKREYRKKRKQSER